MVDLNADVALLYEIAYNAYGINYRLSIFGNLEDFVVDLDVLVAFTRWWQFPV
mgnify:CR=1 FL=1